MKFIISILISTLLFGCVTQSPNPCLHPHDLGTASKILKEGMQLNDARVLLTEAGFGVGSKHQLSVISTDTTSELEFCKLDDDITLIITYELSSKSVRSLALYMFPPHRTNKAQIVVKEVSFIHLLGDSNIAVEMNMKE